MITKYATRSPSPACPPADPLRAGLCTCPCRARIWSSRLERGVTADVRRCGECPRADGHGASRRGGTPPGPRASDAVLVVCISLQCRTAGSKSKTWMLKSYVSSRGRSLRRPNTSGAPGRASTGHPAPYKKFRGRDAAWLGRAIALLGHERRCVLIALALIGGVIGREEDVVAGSPLGGGSDGPACGDAKRRNFVRVRDVRAVDASLQDEEESLDAREGLRRDASARHLHEAHREQGAVHLRGGEVRAAVLPIGPARMSAWGEMDGFRGVVVRPRCGGWAFGGGRRRARRHSPAPDAALRGDERVIALARPREPRRPSPRVWAP